jgi:hypothetical protein
VGVTATLRRKGVEARPTLADEGEARPHRRRHRQTAELLRQVDHLDGNIVSGSKRKPQAYAPRRRSDHNPVESKHI